MDPLELATRVAAIERRRTGSDAERRAALLLADELRAVSRRRRRSTEVRTLWVRPHRGPVHALLAALAVAGSLLAPAHPGLGLGLTGAALVLLLGDLSGRFGLVRRLTPARATQDVVARDPREAPVRLVITAAVDVPSPGLAGRGQAARLEARLRRALRGHLAGPYGLLAVALVALVGCTVARVLGADGVVLGALQLGPTLVALLAVGAGLDQAASAPARQGAGADASAAAVAVALVAALDAEPPRVLAVDCVLAGAGGAHALGLRRWIAGERRTGRRAEEVAVLHLAACGAGRPVFWERDGLVLPLRFHPRLVALARGVGLAPHATRGSSGARAARAAGWPAIAIGCVDADGVVPRLGTDADTADRLDPAAMGAALAGALALVRALDAELAAAGPAALPAAPGARRPRSRLPARSRPPVVQPPPDAWRERPLAAPPAGSAAPPGSSPPPAAVPPPPAGSARAARRAAAAGEAPERP